MTSFGSSSSSAFSRMTTSGLTASSQNCCSRLADLSAVLAADGTFVATTRSIFTHQIHWESGVPCPFAFATLVLLSSLEPKVVSRNADAASDNATSGACGSSQSSGSSSVAGSSSSILAFLPGGGSSPVKILASFCCVLADDYGFEPFCMAPRLSVWSLSFMDFMLSASDSIVLVNSSLPDITILTCCLSQVKSQWKWTVCSFYTSNVDLRNLVS